MKVASEATPMVSTRQAAPVVEESKTVITPLQAYPNPFGEQVTFPVVGSINWDTLAE